MSEETRTVRVEHPGKATAWDLPVPAVPPDEDGCWVPFWVARVGGSHTDYVFKRRPAPICSNNLARAMMDGNADILRDRERGK